MFGIFAWLINGTNKISSLATFIMYNLRSSNQKRNHSDFDLVYGRSEILLEYMIFAYHWTS